MLTLKEIVHRCHQIDEAANDLPQMLILKRRTIRVLPGGKRIAEYSHDTSGFSIIYPMMFSKGGKK